jgi:hypothetical protein
MTSPVVDVLLDARALLARPGGWIQGREALVQSDGSVSYCIQGAIHAAEAELGVWSGAATRVTSVLGVQIPAYNDTPGRTQAEVIETLDHAIAAEWNGVPILRADPLRSSRPQALLEALEGWQPPSDGLIRRRG